MFDDTKLRARLAAVKSKREPLGLNVRFTHPDGTIDEYSFRTIEQADEKREQVRRSEGYTLLN